jgi:hypothetical protein
MTDPEIPESAITRRYADSLFIEIPWAPEGYLFEVACIRGDSSPGAQFFAQVFAIEADSDDSSAMWNSEDDPNGGVRWITDIDEFAAALDECPISGIDHDSLTPSVRRLLLAEQQLLAQADLDS